MATQPVHIFDASLHAANLWLKELAAKLGPPDPHVAYWALRATLHALRDRLPLANAINLGAQLPLLIRGLYYEAWHVAGTPTKERHREAFIGHVADLVPREVDLAPEPAVRAVFALLAERIDPGEVTKVIGVLPADLRSLWPGEEVPIDDC